MGASDTLAVDPHDRCPEIARSFGVSTVIKPGGDVVAKIREATNGRGVDVAIEVLGIEETFVNALRVLRPGGALSRVGVYSVHLQIPLDGFAARIGDHSIVTTLCPGCKERMRRLMRLVASRRIDLTRLFAHVFPLDEIARAYELLGARREGVLKIRVS